MLEDEFDLVSLAEFLQRPAAEVQKLAERGRLPGRKVGGSWRFAKAEITDWLTAKMGESSAEQLQDMEAVLNNPKGRTPLGAMSLANALTVERIAIPLAAKTRGKVISAMTAIPVSQGLVWDADSFAAAVLEREEMMSTALETGVALLHPRRPMPSILGDSFLALGITSSGIPFGGSHGGLTDVFFLIGALEDRWHLRVLAKLSRLAANEDALAALRSASNAFEAMQAVQDFEFTGEDV